MSIAEKLTQIAENEQRVYDAGKQAEYDRFWDEYQNYGERIAYNRGYTGQGFNFNNFYPKYNITVQGSAIQMFYGWSTKSSHEGNLEQRLVDCKVTLDTSQATDMSQAFAYGRMSHLPLISLKNCTATTSTSNIFAYCYQYLKSVKIEVSKDTKFSNMFVSTNGIEHLSVIGTIAQNGFDIHWSTNLSKASITSIINALSGATNGLTITLSQTAVNNAFTTQEWEVLISPYINWNISLV